MVCENYGRILSGIVSIDYLVVIIDYLVVIID